MFDKIVKLSCGSWIQHGPFNDRIYLLEASTDDIENLPKRLIDLARKEKYGKIFVKAKASEKSIFELYDFCEEARIPGMLSSGEDIIFLAYYLKNTRAKEHKLQSYLDVLQLALDKKDSKATLINPLRHHIRQCSPEDIDEMAELYRKVFPTYPFPIYDKEFLLKTMNENVDYFCIETSDKILALASAEKNPTGLYAEMTDFATLPEARGKGFAYHLLRKMEKSIKAQEYVTAFTIARAISPGMNITFARSGYAYGGRLKNNTNISGQIESMNIWYKNLLK